MPNKMKLLPIGTRISHHENNPDYGHGRGTIVDYNGREPNDYLNNNFKEAVGLAASVGLLGGIVAGFYDKNRCPYVIRFDPSDEYPKGYKDVYEPSSANPIDEPNIFRDMDTNVLRRQWLVEEQKWSDWEIPKTDDLTGVEYETVSKAPTPTCPDVARNAS